jgi:hypothetical protein
MSKPPIRIWDAERLQLLLVLTDDVKHGGAWHFQRGVVACYRRTALYRMGNQIGKVHYLPCFQTGATRRPCRPNT